MNSEVFSKEYNTNIQLEVLYDVLDGLYVRNKFKYPDDTKDLIDKLLKNISSYIYHSCDGYDIISDEIYSRIVYKKNNFKNN